MKDVAEKLKSMEKQRKQRKAENIPKPCPGFLSEGEERWGITQRSSHIVSQLPT
jgi:hypothetical protein